jgi:adenine phosphoribosyltransferase
MVDLRQHIRTIPDYPKPGIMFRDVTTLMSSHEALRETTRQLTTAVNGHAIDKIVGIEARGFIFGTPVAHEVGAGFVPLRKKGKLPGETHSQSYELEYGTDELEIHIDAVEPGEKVVIIDDLIATGGTAEAAVHLLTKAGAEIVSALFVIDLPELGGAEKLRQLGIDVVSLVAFDGH